MQQELDMLVEAAEELKNLKETLAQQQDASVRIKAFSALLERVTEQVSRIPAGLAAILDRAGIAEEKLVAAAAQVVALRESVPEIVARIERSDVGRSIEVLSASITESRAEFQGFREMVSHLEAITRQLQTASESGAQKFADQLQQSLKAYEKTTTQVAALRAELEARFEAVQVRVDASGGSMLTAMANQSKVLDALRSAGEGQVKLMQQLTGHIVKLRNDEIEKLRADIGKIASKVEKQASALEVLSKKKGFTF
ncbi:hypothetical protein BJN34_21285 [Cupriavidus necator]|uniref:Uncharacterized protein n=1 Tax=Cupriavidus necator TaxID=106590 RepID=A0A1U9UW87_CUPNE|nr:hypothetical protein [Cupriavidus necator]AQV96405.1 hypothetical protein BJN34_21285 [Cupriavidus necator]